MPRVDINIGGKQPEKSAPRQPRQAAGLFNKLAVAGRARPTAPPVPFVGQGAVWRCSWKEPLKASIPCYHHTPPGFPSWDTSLVLSIFYRLGLLPSANQRRSTLGPALNCVWDLYPGRGDHRADPFVTHTVVQFTAFSYDGRGRVRCGACSRQHNPHQDTAILKTTSRANTRQRGLLFYSAATHSQWNRPRRPLETVPGGQLSRHVPSCRYRRSRQKEHADRSSVHSWQPATSRVHPIAEPDTGSQRRL